MRTWSTLKKLIWLRKGVMKAASWVWKTVTGSLLHITDALAGDVSALSVAINPVQDLHGYDSPWPAGGGVNLFPPMVDGTYEGNGVKAVVKDGIATLSGTTTSSGNALIIPLSKTWTAPASFYYHLGNSSANTSLAPSIENSSSPGTGSISPSCSPANRIAGAYTNNGGITYDRIRFYLANNVTISGTYAPMMCLDNTARSYVPYSNICPISGHTQAKIWREVTHDTSANPTITIDLDGTIYSGTLDVLTGVLTVTKAFIKLGSLSWTTGSDSVGQYFKSNTPVDLKYPTQAGLAANALCERYPVSASNNVYNASLAIGWSAVSPNNVPIYVRDFSCENLTAFQTAIADTKLVYELKTTTTVQLTPAQLATLAGENYVWCDTGDISLTYKAVEPNNKVGTAKVGTAKAG